MTLDKTKTGQKIKITSINRQDIKVQAIRLGIAEGVEVICQEVLPKGPIVLRKNKQEIAIGRQIAKEILVQLI
jgi:Fe2+ transport system protein FeoA